ncbi:MAG: RIO1 family regulatory kinase/ATPase domain-containing protein [Candidatus Helarchaeales archaeon]
MIFRIVKEKLLVVIIRFLKVFPKLTHEDFRVLGGVERGMVKFKEVPIEQISRLLGKSYNMEEVSYRLQRAHKFGLVKRKKGAYVGYYLTFMGYDCLALHALVEGGVLSHFGQALGVGKESDVFDALTPDDRRVAVKIHRLGRISFRQIKRVRSYSSEKKHISWLYQSRLSAQREFEALKVLFPAGVAVPEPIAHNRHVIVMSIIEGDLLQTCLELENPEDTLEKIIENMKKTYQKEIIHCDLSEYNILVLESGDILIIDWPQWISKAHPNAEFFLRRDLQNVLKFFSRKFRINQDLEEVYNRIVE